MTHNKLMCVVTAFLQYNNIGNLSRREYIVHIVCKLFTICFAQWQKISFSIIDLARYYKILLCLTCSYTN